MRRPRFSRWIRLEVLKAASASKFSLRRLAWLAQHDHNTALQAALLLYAHENNQIDRLYEFIYDEALSVEYKEVEGHLGRRSVERLALRGSPMMQLPQHYRSYLERFALAYHTPEQQASDKERLCRSSAKLLQISGLSPTEVAKALKLDTGNIHAYLVRGETGRFTLRTAHEIDAYLQTAHAQL